MTSVHSLIRPQGDTLVRLLDLLHPRDSQRMTRQAFTSFELALGKTAWGSRHRTRFALVDQCGRLGASAEVFELAAVVNQRPARLLAISPAVVQDGEPGQELVRAIMDVGRRAGADMALLSLGPDECLDLPSGFEPLPCVDLELRVTESLRHGAPMALVRSGEDRDLPAIVAMNDVRAEPFSFHLQRSADQLKFGVTRRRLVAGLRPAGLSQLQFVVAEEGITAAAYAVVAMTDGVWTLAGCGDRDPTGARVGAILQALIALEPAERRPMIRAWLPAGFLPPQVTVECARPSRERMFLASLKPDRPTPRFSADELLYWLGDLREGAF